MVTKGRLTVLFRIEEDSNEGSCHSYFFSDGTGLVGIIVGVFLIVNFFSTIPVTSADQTITSQTSWSPGDYLTTSVSYHLDADITSSDGKPGEMTEWRITLKNGEITFDGSVNLGSLSESFSDTYDLPLGTSVEIPVPDTGGALKITVESTAEARNINVTSGPAQTNVSSLYFSSEGSKEFDVIIEEDAAGGNTVKVSGVEIVPTIEVGLKEEVPLVGPGEIAKAPLGARAFEPSLKASASVRGEEGGLGGSEGLPVSPSILVGIVMIIAIVGVLAFYTI